jgi:hypothetical protein
MSVTLGLPVFLDEPFKRPLLCRGEVVRHMFDELRNTYAEGEYASFKTDCVYALTSEMITRAPTRYEDYLR